MSGRSKGFDPLSNLFSDAPASSSPAGGRASEAAVAEDATETVVDPAAVVVPAEPAQPAAPPAAPADLDKAALAKKLAAEAHARLAAEKSDAEKADLAKALAKAAIAKNSAASKAAEPALAKPRPSLADRAGGGRRMSALEAARAAAAEEAARKEEAARRSPSPKTPAALPPVSGVGGLTGGVLGPGVQEEAPRLAQQRELLSALWKAHTHRLASDGRWVEAGSCAAVVDALERLGPGQLAAVPARAGDDKLLVWVDIARRAVIAVIPDGGNYLTGL